jgi:hypothetical protein
MMPVTGIDVSCDGDREYRTFDDNIIKIILNGIQGQKLPHVTGKKLFSNGSSNSFRRDKMTGIRFLRAAWLATLHYLPRNKLAVTMHYESRGIE